MIYLNRLKDGNGPKFSLLESKHLLQQTEICESSNFHKNTVVFKITFEIKNEKNVKFILEIKI